MTKHATAENVPNVVGLQERRLDRANPAHLSQAMKSVPWTTLQEMKGDTSVLKKIEDAEELLKSLRNALTST
jgi:hypothetical protein